MKYAAVAEWTFNVPMPDVCAICRNQLTDICVNCQADGSPRDRCLIDLGQCKHAYHKHCIDQWLMKMPKCPTDSGPWVLIE